MEDLENKIIALEKENEELNSMIKDYQDILKDKDGEIEKLENDINGVQELIYQINKII